VAETVVKDASKSVGKLSEGRLAALVAGNQLVVVAAGTGGSGERRVGPPASGISQQPVAGDAAADVASLAGGLGDRGVAEVVLAGASIEVASRGGARLPQNPGAEEAGQPWKTRAR